MFKLLMAKGLPTLDLHGLKRDEVWDKIDRFLLNQAENGAPRVRIMTGKGQGIVREETEKYLRQAKYHFSVEKLDNGKPNEGVLVVYME